ncbi:Uma2 family endonuclease [Ancylothrix sp. C2]|uniref:Uma2 family endonuclease n=1 Tax=Ancylothrix sp. D3o TaxID=2953691 RepID=UPI0021BAA0D1|nr:Uma2 family endonuclease [Ancylothrix sp. D3o]MCT7949380.1 Uma2 family endonuclease [Ancylothrix sp. D3o]
MIIKVSEKVSLQDFLQLPETKPAREYINGEIYQKPMPQGEHSIIQTDLATAINQIGRPQKLACAFTELRCSFGDGSVVPDITVFEWSRIPRLANGRIANRFEIAPDWTIEILSPEQSASRVIKKITFCLNNGTKLGWFVDPDDESVTIFEPNRTPSVKSDEEILTVLEVLGDWHFSVNKLFECLYLT